MVDTLQFTRCLLELPRFTVNDVRRIVRGCSSAPQSTLEKGFRFYVSSYLCNYEVSGRNRATSEISVRAHCYRSMKKAAKPHQLRITLCDSDPVVLVTSSCSCVAGIGLCNHLVALLYQTPHYSECGMSAVPPVLSCTETEQKWHKPRTMGVKPGPVDAMVVVKPKPGATSSSGVRSALYKGYSGELPDPATLNPTAVYTDFDPDSLPLICSMNISPDKPLVDSIFGKVQAGSILSYQHPPPTSDCVITHMDAPLFPKVPLEDYHLKPTDCKYVPTEQEQLHLQSLSVTKSQSHNIEEST
ncbi:uncharacterized protein [Nothobranchius furzeri]|uniref:uncharacterized protein isoform X1 n=1 Tax=Nothobranchius furzeri TaxID=105023 RepID=UPI002403B898|nr:uncharacterized protein LOC107375927 isoform X1 [Nothobranchius furzeri]